MITDKCTAVFNFDDHYVNLTINTDDTVQAVL